MYQVLSAYSASISELKKNPSALIDEACGRPIVVLNHNKPTAYLVAAETFERMVDMLDDIALSKLAIQRLGQKSSAVRVNLDEL